MDFQEMRATARGIRAQYADADTGRCGRAWTTKEIMLGFVGDVGDVAKLVQGKAGVRPRENLDAALAHELADCLWSLLTLADAYDIDLETAFDDTMRLLSKRLDEAGHKRG